MNGDGIKDLIFGDRAGLIQHYSRNSSGELTYEGVIQANGADLSLDLQAASPCILDWNEDGLPDIIVGAGIWKTKIPLRLYLNKGTKTSYLYENYEYLFYESDTIKATYPQIEVADLDGDGIRDLLLQDCFYDSWLGGDTTNLFFFKNYGSNSNPAFNSQDTVKYNGNPIKSKLAKLDTKDLNNDGRIDIAVTGSGRDITIYYNDHPVSNILKKETKSNSYKLSRFKNQIIVTGNNLKSYKLFDLSGKLIKESLCKSDMQTITLPGNKEIFILSIKNHNNKINNFKIF